MTLPMTLRGRFFDGRRASAHSVDVAIKANGIAIDGAGVSVFWPAKRLRVIARDDAEIRLADRKDDNARLILDATEAAGPLDAAFPDLLSGRGERRRMTALIVSLIVGAVVVGAAVFFGAPAASGPLARATPKDLEIKMGANLASQINLIVRPCKGAEDEVALLAPTFDRFAADNDVGFPIHFQFVDSDAPNAFALPGGEVMATSGLIDALRDDQEAFLAVVAHELGHVRARDGLQAIYRNAGIGVALDIITGGSGAAQQAVILAGQVSQLRHSRRQESLADDAAAEILTKEGLDPAALARAFDAITAAAKAKGADEDDDIPSWLSSHPDTARRIENAKKRARPGGKLPIAADAWTKVAGACGN